MASLPHLCQFRVLQELVWFHESGRTAMLLSSNTRSISCATPQESGPTSVDAGPRVNCDRMREAKHKCRCAGSDALQSIRPVAQGRQAHGQLGQ